MEYLQIIFGTLGGAAAAVAAVKFLGKSLISNALTKSLEDHKAKLKKQTDTALETLKAANAAEIEVVKSELEEGRSLNAARRDYEYEARKRLYREYEPLLFQFVEAAVGALYRIYSLARSSRIEALREDGTGWLAGKGYYLSSTIYNLLSPLAVFKLIQRRMTLIDLRLDPSIVSHYTIAKWIYISYTDDFEFAKAHPSLNYNPNCADWEQKRKNAPSVHWRQGLPIGRLDSALDAMIVQDGEVQRVLSFGEFDSAFFDPASTLSTAFEPITDVFTGFHPQARPVLWRILVAQAYMFSAVTRRKYIQASESDGSTPWIIEGINTRDQLDWRPSGRDADEELALVQPFDVAEEYLVEHLKDYINFSTPKDV